MWSTEQGLLVQIYDHSSIGTSMSQDHCYIMIPYIGILACKTFSVTVITVNPCAKKQDNKRPLQRPTFTLNRTAYWRIPGQRSYHAQACLGSPSME